MRLIDRYPGAQDPFEGDHTLTLRSLPEGARVTRAVLTLTPVAAPGGVGATETILFDDATGVGALGATREPASLDPGTFWASAQLNARRSISGVIAAREVASGGSTSAPTAADGGRVSVQMDIGGVWMGVAADGTLETPDKAKLILTLPPRPTSGRPSSTPLPPITSEKIKLTAMTSEGENTNGQVFLYGVVVRVVASNISVRLGQLPPFWTRLGDLAGAATSPDFAAVLNAFLAEAQPQNGFYSVPFTLHSDSLARLDVEVTIDFVVEQPVLPPHLPQATATFGASTRPSLAESLTTVTLPRQAVPVTGRSSAQIQGQFQSTRVAAGPVGDTPPVLPVEVSPARTLAQPILLDQEVHVLGVDLPLSSPLAILSGLHIAFQLDDDGKPSGDILPGGDGQPASAAVRVDRPLPNQSTWGIATFTTPVRLQAARRYWLALQSTDGKAFWDATPGTATPPAVLAPPLLASEDGGLSWRVATVPRSVQPLAALIRLRHQVDHFTIPVQLQIGTGPNAVRRRLNEFDPLGRVEFTFDFAEALTTHLATQATTAPCATAELLVNGGFDDPPSDDATRRLFGSDSVSSRGIIVGAVDLSQGVNLSVQRFITLAIDDRPPQRIDCAGPIPARTTLSEVVAAINRAVGVSLAAANTGRLTLNPVSAFDTDGSLLLWQPAGAPQGWSQVGVDNQADGRAASITRQRCPVLRMPASNESLPPIVALPPEKIVAALVSTGGSTTILAQRMDVTAGCAYALRAQVLVQRRQQTSTSPPPPGQEPSPTAAWEVDWLAANGQSLRIDSSVLEEDPFQQRNQSLPFTSLDVRLTAPEGAIQAELRFSQQPPDRLFLDDVSFRATAERLANALFVYWIKTDDPVAPRQPQGWLLSSGNIQQTAEGALLISNAQEDAVLLQTAEVKAGQRYSLTVQARASQPLDDAEAAAPTTRARLELRWLGDSPIGAPVLIPLDGRDFPTHTWTGEAPAGAIRAELRLVQPVGGETLILNQVTLTELDTVAVPLIFLSETPGELTLSNLRVAYDLPSPPPPRRPTNGPAQARSGTRGLAVALVASPPPAPRPSPSPLAPPLAPTPVEPVAPAAPPAPPSVVEERVTPVTAPETPVPTPPAVPVDLGDAPTPGPPGLVDIKGIGPARARQLVDLGITSLADLAAASPRDIVARLRGVSEAAAEDFIRQARQIVEAEPHPPAPPATSTAPTAADLPLTLVAGLGAARVARLTEVGIDSLQKLAEAAPEDVARVLRGVSLEMAAGFIQAARQALEAEGRP